MTPDILSLILAAQSHLGEAAKEIKQFALDSCSVAQALADCEKERIWQQDRGNKYAVALDRLLYHAKAVRDRWDSPLWSDLPHTAEYISALRKAIEEAEK